MIMNKAAWASAHGLSVVDGGVQGPALPAPEGAPEADPVPALEAELRAAQAEIARQADLVRQLQMALRSEIAKNRPPAPSQVQKLGGAAPPPATRVIRRRRSAKPAGPSTTKE